MNLKWIVWMMMGLLLSLSYGSSGTEADETAGAQGPPVQGEQIDSEIEALVGNAEPVNDFETADTRIY
jgi:hypothetical protein